MKAALNHMTLSLAPILGPREITINAVMPGYIETEQMESTLSQPGKRDIVAGLSAMKRIGAPDDVAQIVRFLASERARWITGQIIDATGGSGLLGGAPYPAS
jgi:NAD(P)-dependent dehydrogenase (short-subunit alcohol dehydrogenase family)